MEHLSDASIKLAELLKATKELNSIALRDGNTELSEASTYLHRIIMKTQAKHILSENTDASDIAKDIDELHRYKMKGSPDWNYYSEKARKFYEEGITCNVKGLDQEALTIHLSKRIRQQADSSQ